MDIEHNKQQALSNSFDSWADKEDLGLTELPTQLTLFNKVEIKYDDKMIEVNVDGQCQKPILNSTIFPYLDDKIQQQDLQETQQEKSMNIGHKNQNIMSNEQRSKHQKPKKTTQYENQQALFNAVEDEENESWMRRKIRSKPNSQRPLTCPQCFTQVCYIYEPMRQKQQTGKNLRQNFSEPMSLLGGQKTYRTAQVQNIKIHEHKIIRNRFASEKMSKAINYEQKDKFLNEKDLETYQKTLREHYQDINVKILISCEQCQNQLGYWNVNQEKYVLFNVV